MDAQATKMLTKGLFTRKRKEKAQDDGSKRVKVGVSSFRVPTSTTATSEVIIGTKIAPNVEIDTTSIGLVPSMPSGPSSGDQVLELSIKKRIEEGRKKKAIVKTSCRVARRFPELGLSFLEEMEDDMDAGLSNAVVDLFFYELAFGTSKPTIEVSKPVQKPKAVESDPAPPSKFSTNANPLPQVVSIKPLIKNLRKEVHLLRKKMKKMEDDLQASRKNAFEMTKEVSHL
ncbi:hypothetical protein COCNU_scaffold003759G000010 [Cocos nucifera]|nr:hypothetical protein [Cocos nucifera]